MKHQWKKNERIFKEVDILKKWYTEDQMHDMERFRRKYYLESKRRKERQKNQWEEMKWKNILKRCTIWGGEGEAVDQVNRMEWHGREFQSRNQWN